MASLRDIRKRIKSVKNTQKITKAMKMVAAAKLKRAQENAEAARPYANKMDEVVAGLMQNAGSSDVSHPLMGDGDASAPSATLVLTSNRGLCGGFNAVAIRSMLKLADSEKSEGREAHVYTAGKKGYEGLRKSVDLKNNYEQIFQELSFESASDIATELCEQFTSGEVGKVSILYNEFKGPLRHQQLLPIVAPEESDDQKGSDYEYEPSPEEIFKTLLPKYIATQIFQALLETLAAEHLARMMAMDAATNNAKEVVGKLTLQYNRARQAAITTELMEIIGGAEALK